MKERRTTKVKSSKMEVEARGRRATGSPPYRDNDHGVEVSIYYHLTSRCFCSPEPKGVVLLITEMEENIEYS